MFRLRLVVSTLLFLLPAALPTRASPVDLFGFGARAQALVGALGATADGVEAVYYNPAALTTLKRPRFMIGYQTAMFSLNTSVGYASPSTPHPARAAPALNVGFAVPLALGGPLTDRLALGLGFTIPQTSVFIADIARPSALSFPLLENRAQTVSVQASLAFRVTDALSLGVGTLALAALTGEVAVAPNAAGQIAATVQDELVANYNFVAGALLRLLPTSPASPTAPSRHLLSLGLTYRTASRADFDLPVTTDLGPGFIIPIPPLTVHGTAQFDPAELALELASELTDFLTLSTGITWERWSAFPLPLAYTAVPPGTPPQPLPNFHDTVSLKFGAEAHFALGALTLHPRLGLSWAPTPAPAQTGFHNHLDSDRFIAGAGLGLRWSRLRLDLAAQVQGLATRTATKDPTLSPDNPGFPRVTAGGTVWVGALELGVDL